jgi:hypothetical protein
MMTLQQYLTLDPNRRNVPPCAVVAPANPTSREMSMYPAGSLHGWGYFAVKLSALVGKTRSGGLVEFTAGQIPPSVADFIAPFTVETPALLRVAV